MGANRFTLLAGTYIINARVPAYAVNIHKSMLYNITDAAVEIGGSSAYANFFAGTAATGSCSFINGLFTITGTKTFEIRHKCQTTTANTGLGHASNYVINEEYTDIQLWKVA